MAVGSEGQAFELELEEFPEMVDRTTGVIEQIVFEELVGPIESMLEVKAVLGSFGRRRMYERIIAHCNSRIGMLPPQAVFRVVGTQTGRFYDSDPKIEEVSK